MSEACYLIFWHSAYLLLVPWWLFQGHGTADIKANAIFTDLFVDRRLHVLLLWIRDHLGESPVPWPHAGCMRCRALSDFWYLAESTWSKFCFGLQCISRTWKGHCLSLTCTLQIPPPLLFTFLVTATSSPSFTNVV